MYDGVHVPVSQLLGVGFKSRFLARFCIPVFGPAVSGFDSAPRPQHVPASSVLRTASEDSSVQVPVTGHESSNGVYRLKYVLAPQIAVHPDAFVRSVPQDGPFPIQNLWSDRDFHHSIL